MRRHLGNEIVYAIVSMTTTGVRSFSMHRVSMAISTGVDAQRHVASGNDEQTGTRRMNGDR